MSRVYRIEQTVVHVITVKADSLDQVERMEQEMSAGDFTDRVLRSDRVPEWGDTNIIKLPKKVTEADVDLTED